MNSKIHARHRKQLLRMLGVGSIAILPAAPVRCRNRDVDYPYRQDSDFFYLSGFDEPEAVIVLLPGRKNGEYILFCRDKDEKQEIWHGRRVGPEGVVENFAADDAFPIDDIDDILPGLMESCERVYHTMGLDPEFDKRVMEWVNVLRKQSRSGGNVPYEFVSLDYLLHDMRLFKSRDEIRVMKKAAKISVEAHKKAMEICQPGVNECELDAIIMYEFQRNGATWAYPSIVGGGANSCILHYTENNMPLNDGEMVLIDAGCELDGYDADITRAFPVNGKYSAPQKEIFDLVVQANLAGIKKVKPGNHWNDPHLAAVKVLTKGMIELGLLKGTLSKLIKNEAYKKYYMHRTGHWLGMDVHDVGDYKVDEKWRLLEPGMVLTIEPGIYISQGSRGAKRWWNIGVRIEDDVVVTKKGCEVLTHGLPKTTEGIEAIMAGKK
ncbi:Xaa-Pro aminopeptidase [hydrothermal vent metagenome]|uniref:Xaa-Pro aminopeptidase n=1 Tax=hydrothermal vent metagenome TaxID=652676 RepID=A0A3B0X6D8_9ZZZZ